MARRHGARVRKNPLHASQFREGGTALIGVGVIEMKYRHANDHHVYSHKFGPNVHLYGRSDGTLYLRSLDGEPLWENREV